MPVDRTSSNDVVQQVAGYFAQSQRMIFALAPEGTRKQVDRWKTGFYHIARAAGVPIVPVALDWTTKAVKLMPAFQTTGAADVDIAALQLLYDGMREAALRRA